MERQISCVYFMLKNKTEMNTEVIHNVSNSNMEVIKQAKEKLLAELGIDIDQLSKRVGINKESNGDWIIVDFVDYV